MSGQWRGTKRFGHGTDCPFSSDQPALNRILSVLGGIDAIRPKHPAMLGPSDVIFELFRSYLSQERGLATERLPVTNLLFAVSSERDAKTS